MFLDADIHADRLPPKTLCLTFDDGPCESDGDGAGPHTWELARWLHREEIRATFFVIGRHVAKFPDTLAALSSFGHLVGNHTETHPDLVALAAAGGDVVGEIARASETIQRASGMNTVFVRPPFGHWRAAVSPDDFRELPRSPVARLLNADPRTASLVGPIQWDVSGEDWNCWRFQASIETAVEHHLRRIHRVGRGIVLLHDGSHEPGVQASNRTFELIRHLVPELKRNGYQFVCLDEIPQVRSALAVSRLVELATADGAPLGFLEREGGIISVVGTGDSFGVVPRGEGLISLRAPNGCYLTAPPTGGVVTADALVAGEDQTFATHQGSLRTTAGGFLSLDRTAKRTHLTAATGLMNRSDEVQIVTEDYGA
jgi:peptidoglycan/xylan/chitin deacetylase (PgdA/CDA1 family)